MDYIKSLLNRLQAKIIHIGLITVFSLLVLYLTCSKFRIFLADQHIDSNFIIGFFTILALFLSLIQSSKDKRYSYNLKLIDSIEDKGIKVIGKLIGIKNKSHNMLSSVKHCIEAKKAGSVFKDLNDSCSKKDVEYEMELIVAYVNLYFPEQGEKWNDLSDKLTQVLNITGNILVNYNENLELIQRNVQFNNLPLDNADISLKEAEKIDQEIENLTLTMRDEIVVKMDDSKRKLKDTFNFKL